MRATSCRPRGALRETANQRDARANSFDRDDPRCGNVPPMSRVGRGLAVAVPAALLVSGLASCRPRDAAAPDGGRLPDDDAGPLPTEDGGSAAPLRMIAPMSTAFVSTRRPTLRWTLPAGVLGAHVEICADAECTAALVEFDAEGDHGTPPGDLDPGAVFWRACALGAPAASCSPYRWSFVVPRRSTPRDTSWGTFPDHDRDGYGDVIVGAPGPAATTGIVFRYSGGAAGLAPAVFAMDFTPLGSGVRNYGTSVAMVGVVIGGRGPAVAIGGFGKVFLTMYGRGVTEIPSGGPDTPYGFASAGAGDVDGDGFADLIVGSSNDGAGSTVVLLNYGGAYIEPGGVEIPLYVGESSGYIVPSGATSERFGRSLSSAGDVDGDGLADVIIGAPGASRAYVYRGEPSRPVTATPIVLEGPPGSRFGTSVACAGDVNGDGLSDVVVGAPLADRAYVYLGDEATGLVATPIELSAPGAVAADLGWSVAGAGDVDGDGFGDVVVGAPAAESGFGRAFVYSGSTIGLGTTPTAALVGAEPSGADFGRTVAGLGDVDGDGVDDIAVGAPGAPPGLRGAVLIFRGAVGGIATSPAWRLDGRGGDDQGFGAAIARAL